MKKSIEKLTLKINNEMKKIILVFTVVLFSINLFAQAPELLSYQAVIRNSNGVLVASAPVGIQISILQGSASGTAVYVETQTPMTNVNGLVTIEIGGGTVVSGTFATINWAKSTYFIETETDLAGGVDYTITGTSQLLSVPYALYAKTSDSISGGEKEPAFNASVAKHITAPDTAKWSAKQSKLTGGTDISIAGDSVSITGHYVGESYGGGTVFYVYDNGLHGLIVTTKDQSTSMRWYAGTNSNTMALANGVGAGKANTAIIIASQGYGDGATYAARVCNEYCDTVGGVIYGDWYLPSFSELQLLFNYYAKYNLVGEFSIFNYWSSTELDISNAMIISFGSGLNG